MSKEIISEVKVLDSGKLLLVLESGGQNSYQYIYREAAGVYWEPNLKGFISTEPKKWSYSEWFEHIVKVADQFGVKLSINSETKWSGISEKEKKQILKEIAT